LIGLKYPYLQQEASILARASILVLTILLTGCGSLGDSYEGAPVEPIVIYIGGHDASKED
jgi:hypothetical protein